MPKHDPTQPTAELKIGQRTYHLDFDFEAVAEAEDILDRPLIAGLSQRDVKHPKISTVRAMLYAGLRRKHPAITVEEANALVTVKTLQPIWQHVLVAYANFCAEPEENAPNPQPAQS